MFETHFGLGKRKTHLKETAYNETSLFQVLDSETLLAHKHYQHLLSQLTYHVGASADQFDTLYTNLICAFVEYVQILPVALQAPLGGLLDHGLRRGCQAIAAAHTEKITDPLLLYAIFSAGLCLDVGKVVAGKRVMLSDRNGNYHHVWQPFAGSMVSQGDYYKIRAWRGIEPTLAEINPLLAKQLMGEAAFAWLASDQEILTWWLTILTGGKHTGGKLAHFLKIAEDHLTKTNAQGFEIPIDIDVLETPDTEVGEALLAWLKAQLDANKLAINEEQALVHVLEEGVFLEWSALFEQFNRQHGERYDAEMVLRQFGEIVLQISAEDLRLENYLTGALGQTMGERSVVGQFLSEKHKPTTKQGLVVEDGGILLSSDVLAEKSTHLKSKAPAVTAAHDYPARIALSPSAKNK